MNADRKHNEEEYQKFMKEGIELDNAILCELIAENNLVWNPGEALYWKKQGISIREKIFGKNNIENTTYYDKIVEVLLDKGSYKEAVKWNSKSMKIKIKERGEEFVGLLTNYLLLSEAMSLLYAYSESKIAADQAYDILEKNSLVYDQKTVYDAYIQLTFLYARYNIGAKNHNLKATLQNEVCGDKAIQIAKAFYGEQSKETAEAIRNKAITLEYNKQEALVLFAEAIKIYMKFEEDKKSVKSVFHNIRQKWDGKNVLLDSAKWLYDNSSEQFVLVAIEDFDNSDKIEITEFLGLGEIV